MEYCIKARLKKKSIKENQRHKQESRTEFRPGPKPG
jgi:hypothetical protein